jgi:hypothetical protein
VTRSLPLFDLKKSEIFLGRRISALIRGKIKTELTPLCLGDGSISAFVLALAPRWLLLLSKGTLFPLRGRCAWNLWRMCELKSRTRETLEPPYSAHLFGDQVSNHILPKKL